MRFTSVIWVPFAEIEEIDHLYGNFDEEYSTSDQQDIDRDTNIVVGVPCSLVVIRYWWHMEEILLNRRLRKQAIQLQVFLRIKVGFW